MPKIIGLDISAGMLDVGIKNCRKELSNTIECWGFRKYAF
jgi:ubiquinone/menaquinone biosynthesis C-methylase UbiE